MAIINGTIADNKLTGTSGNDTLNGFAGDDTLIGGAGADVLYGDDGDDVLNGGTGADTMYGGIWSDQYYVDNVGDVIVEDPTNWGWGDTVYTTLSTYTLGALLEELEYIGTGNFKGTILKDNGGQITSKGGNDSLTGGAGGDAFWANGGNDTLIGGGGSDFLNGGTGADRMEGGAGHDNYVVDSVNDVVVENPDSGRDGIDTSLYTYTLGANIEDLTYAGDQYHGFTGTGNDLSGYLQGGPSNDLLRALGSNDWVWGFAGNDTLDGGSGADTMEGSEGNDTYVVDDAGDVVSEPVNRGIDTVWTSFASYSLAANFENLKYTGSGSFSGTGNELNNHLKAGANDDTLNGGLGNDTLVGGTGNDTLIGGSGIDTMLGGAGNDIYYVDSATDKVCETTVVGGTVDAGGADLVVSTAASWTLGAYVENLILDGSAPINGTGNGAANTITGNDAANILKGGGGNDTLVGGDGNDTLEGGTGLDMFAGGAGNDTYVLDREAELLSFGEVEGGGVDTLKIMYSNATATVKTIDIQLAFFENITLGGTGKFNLVGNLDDNILVGNASVNKMTGGDGNDTYVVSAGDIVVEGDGMGGGIDTIKSSISYSLVDTDGTGSSGGNVENLILTGTLAVNGTGNDLDNDLTGNGAANILRGNGGNDKLYGLAGADSLYGGLGDDTIYGGTGNDRLDGGEGSDVFVFNTAPNSASNVDAIVSFVSGTDKIKLDAAIFTRLLVDGMTFASGATVSSTSDFDIQYETDTGYLYYDSSGTTSGGLVKFATLTGHPSLVETDIALIDV